MKERTEYIEQYQELNAALNAKPLPELLAYYRSKPDLARCVRWIDWLADWLIGELGGWLAGWLVCRLVG